MRVDFPKKSNVIVQKQRCGISNDTFSCGSGTLESKMISNDQELIQSDPTFGTSSHSILCETAELQVTDCSVCETRTAELRGTVYSLCGSETAELQVTEYSSCGDGTAGLKVKALVWKRNVETSNHTKFIVWKRNCVASKPQYIPCAKAKNEQFQSFKSHNILYAEAELRNF